MHRNGRLFQSEVTDRLRNLGIPVVPREPEWADRTVGAHVLELGSSVEIAELPDDVIMVSALEGGGWKLKDVFFDLDEAVDVAGGLYQRSEQRTHSPNRPARRPPSGDSFAGRSAEARRAPRRRNARSNEAIVLEAVEQAPDRGHGQKWIADVLDQTGLPLSDVQTSLRQLMIDRKVNLSGDDTAHMTKYGAERAEQKRINEGEISIAGAPRHFVRLVQARNGRRPNARSTEDLVFEAVKRAPTHGSHERRLIADVWDDTNLPLEELRNALLNLQEQGKIILMRADAVHMDKRGAEAKEAKRMIDAEIFVGGKHPRHLIFLDKDYQEPQRRSNGRPVVKREVQKQVGPSGSRKQTVTVRAGLRVTPITEGSTRGKYFLDELPEEDFPRRSTLRHDAEHYGIVLDASEVEA